jgi:hypothetical protein
LILKDFKKSHFPIISVIKTNSSILLLNTTVIGAVALPRFNTAPLLVQELVQDVFVEGTVILE